MKDLQLAVSHQRHSETNAVVSPSAVYVSAPLCLWLSLLIIPHSQTLCFVFVLAALPQCFSTSLLKTVPLMCLRSVNVTLCMLTREQRCAYPENTSTASFCESIHQALCRKTKQYRADNETAAAFDINTECSIDFLARLTHIHVCIEPCMYMHININLWISEYVRKQICAC